MRRSAGRINKAWGLALRKRFCRSFNLELQAAATDDGINISLAEQHSFPLADVFRFLHPSSVREVLEQAVLASPIFTARWRWDASRALVLQRFQGGKKVPPPIQTDAGGRFAGRGFSGCGGVPGESGSPAKDSRASTGARSDEGCVDRSDGPGRAEGCAGTWVLDGSIQCVAVDTPVPSQFSHEILNANPFAYLDDAPLEERRARAVEMRRMLPETVWRKWASWIRRRLRKCGQRLGRMCATRMSCMTCCRR